MSASFFLYPPPTSSFKLNGKHMCLQGLFLLPFKAVRRPRNHFMALKESGRYAEGTKLWDGAHVTLAVFLHSTEGSIKEGRWGRGAA